MGKCCVRFRSLDALALDVIGDAMSRVTVTGYVAAYRKIRARAARSSARGTKRTAKPRTVKPRTAKPRTTKPRTTKPRSRA